MKVVPLYKLALKGVLLHMLHVCKPLQSVDEAALLENTSEKKDDEFELSVEQLKMQRDMLRTELAKSLEHKKKTDQYSMEAKQHAQRVMCVCARACVCVLHVCACMHVYQTVIDLDLFRFHCLLIGSSRCV